MNKKNIVKRGVATIIDYTTYFLIDFVYIITFGEAISDNVLHAKGWYHFIFPIIFWILYFPLIESRNGKTLGHYITNLKVINLKGGKISFTQSFKRRSLDSIELILTFGILAVIIVFMFNKNQRLGDLLANTSVVQD